MRIGLLALALVACEAPEVIAFGSSSASSVVVPSASASGVAPIPSVSASVVASAWSPPSRELRGPMDRLGEPGTPRCLSLRTGLAKASLRCGLDGSPKVDIDHLTRAVRPLDPPVRAHVREVLARGKALGRNPRIFGLVGDSITVSQDFLVPFSTRSRSRVTIDPRVRPLVALASDADIIGYFRAVPPPDGFAAQRAAKVGARASWPVLGGVNSAVARLVAQVNPAFVVVAFGANDATFRPGAPEGIADEFERNLDALIDDLESRGIVVILSNEMRHLHQPGLRACPADGDPNDFTVARATNATNERVGNVALRRHLPFIDLRFALEHAMNHGLGPDGVHPSVFAHGGGVLDEQGLQCGYNIRNLVTLSALRDVVAFAIEEGFAVAAGPQDSSMK